MGLTPYIKSPVTIIDPDHLLDYFDPNDPCLNAGTKLIVDLDRVTSFPAQADPPNGAILYNLKSNPNAIVVKTGLNIVFDEKGFRFNATSGNYIRVGAVGDYRLSEEGHPDFAYDIWYKRESATTYGSYPILFGRTQTWANYDYTKYEFMIQLGSDGNGLNFAVSDGTSGKTIVFVGTELSDYQALLGQTVHIGMAMEGGSLKAFVNGVLVKTVSGFAGTYSTYNTQPIRIGEGAALGNINGVVKRFTMHNLGYGLTAVQIFAKEYELNSVRMTADD